MLSISRLFSLRRRANASNDPFTGIINTGTCSEFHICNAVPANEVPPFRSFRVPRFRQPVRFILFSVNTAPLKKPCAAYLRFRLRKRPGDYLAIKRSVHSNLRRSPRHASSPYSRYAYS